MTGEHIHHYVLHPTLVWDVTSKCNYRCRYCYSEHMPDRLASLGERLSIERVAEAFAEHLHGWAIVFIGGEPFILNEFVEMSAALTSTNLIGIYTNLGLEDQVRRFTERISPKRVTFINCALHAEQRSLRDPGFRSFLALGQMLRDRGFRTAVTYVVHPTVEVRVADDVRQLADLGVKVYLKVFRGVFAGRSYPECYDDATLSFIAAHEPPMMRGRPVRAEVTGEGAACRAGMLLLDMDVDGNVHRCLTERSMRRNCLGNLFAGTLRVLSGPAICPNDVCISARQGMGFACLGVRDLHTPKVPQ